MPGFAFALLLPFSEVLVWITNCSVWPSEMRVLGEVEVTACLGLRRRKGRAIVAILRKSSLSCALSSAHSHRQ